MAAPFPQDKSSPSVSSSVRIPFSKHSIAKETILPAEIVSIPRILHNSFPLMTAGTSVMSHLEPSEARVSYSGPAV
ncbi:MAG: hypothetical protein DDT34_02323 [Firmicutes bacterium]|nr:hypothetical protein [Bacillota bacterium]